MPLRSKANDALEPVARLIGYICIHSANLETRLHELIILLQKLKPPSERKQIHASASAKRKIDLARILCEELGPSDAWTTETLTHLKHAEILLWRRNRYVHDLWIGGERSFAVARIREYHPESGRIPTPTEELTAGDVVSTESQAIDPADLESLIQELDACHELVQDQITGLNALRT